MTVYSVELLTLGDIMDYWFDRVLIFLLTAPIIGIAVVGTLQDMGAL